VGSEGGSRGKGRKGGETRGPISKKGGWGRGRGKGLREGKEGQEKGVKGRAEMREGDETEGEGEKG